MEGPALRLVQPTPRGLLGVLKTRGGVELPGKSMLGYGTHFSVWTATIGRAKPAGPTRVTQSVLKDRAIAPNELALWTSAILLLRHASEESLSCESTHKNSLELRFTMCLSGSARFAIGGA